MQSIGGNREELLSYYFHTQKLAMPAGRKVASDFSGGYQSRFRGRGIDFAEVRGYQPGDDIRLMDWRVTARTGKPHTKVFHEEKERAVFLVVDQSASMQFGSKVTFKSIVAARAAAWLAWMSLHQGDRVGGFIFDNTTHVEFRPKARRQSLLPFIAHLADACQPHPITTTTTPVLLPTLQRLQHVAKPGALIFLISDFYQFDDSVLAPLTQLAGHCELRALSIYDDLEQHAPPPNTYRVSDGQQQRTWNTQSAATRKQFAQQFTARQTFVNQHLQRLQIPLLSLATHDDWIKRLTLATQHWSDRCLQEVRDNG